MEAQIMELVSEDSAIDIAVQICSESQIGDWKWFDKGEQHARNENFFEITVPRYSLDDFQKHFKISRSSMQLLVNLIAPTLRQKSRISLEKKIMFTVWMLTHQETFLSGGDRFKFSWSTAHYIFKETVVAFNQQLYNYVKFPGIAEQRQIAKVFEEKSGIPGIVGAIDGCHIPIKPPKNSSYDYYNRKSFHSIVLQGICDDKMLFRDVFIGMAGRCHDARIFALSPICKNMHEIIPEEHHLMGDCAYPNSDRMITPFRDNGHLTRAQSRFNTSLSSVRQVIERSFGLYKGKCRRLKYLDCKDIVMAVRIAGACVFLHNFVVMNDGIDEAEIETNEEDDSADGVESQNFEHVIETDKRLLYTTYFN